LKTNFVCQNKYYQPNVDDVSLYELYPYFMTKKDSHDIILLYDK